LKSTTNQQNQCTEDRNNIATKTKELIKGLVQDNFTMLTSEERLFSFGESSLFLINTRE
jgi:hypothetical protein